MNYKIGELVYFIENNLSLRKATVIRVSGEFCTLKFLDSLGGITLRNSRLYRDLKDAEKVINRGKPVSRSYSISYDYLGWNYYICLIRK